VDTKNIDWVVAIFLIGYHIALIIALPLYLYISSPPVGLIVAAVIIFFLSGIGITSGYHRLYSHRTYHLNKIAEPILLFLGTLAIENSVLKWAHDHRMHHRYVDTEKDPYSIKKGFWHAHMLWIMEKHKEFDPAVVQDLLKNKLVMFQHKYYLPLMIATNLGVVLLCGWIFNDYAGAFVLTFLARIFVTHHTTWFVNSLAHSFGAQPYSREHSAVNNWLLAFVTLGEGYHNYHHTFTSDYRNGVRWYQYDPTKLFIWILSKIGLAKNLMRVEKLVIKKRLLGEDKKLLLEKLKAFKHSQRKVIEQKVIATEAFLNRKLSEMGQLRERYKQITKARVQEQAARKTKNEMRILETNINQNLKAWKVLCRQVLKGSTA